MFSMAASEYSKIYAKELKSTCDSISKGKTSIELTKVANTTITTAHINTIIRMIDRKGNAKSDAKGNTKGNVKNDVNIVQVLFKAFGDDEKLFDGGMRLTKGKLVLKMSNNETLALPKNNIGGYIATEHEKALQDVVIHGKALNNLIKKYKKDAGSCSEEAKLKFPPAWRQVLVRAPKVMATARELRDGNQAWWGLQDQWTKTELWAGTLGTALDTLGRVRGLADAVIRSTENLTKACRARYLAAKKIQSASKGKVLVNHDVA